MSFESISEQPSSSSGPSGPSGPGGPGGPGGSGGPSGPGAPRWRWFGRLPRAALVGGLAVGVALGGAGIAFAATSGSTTPSTTAPPNSSTPKHGFGGFRGPGPGGPFGLGGLAGFGRVVHGEYTTKSPNGGYQTIEVQTGKVTAVSTTSITVTSADNYSHTYVVASSTMVDSQRDGIGSVAKGDQVDVTATTVSGKDTATNIVDTTKVGASRNSFGFGPRHGPAGPSAPPATPAAPTA
jgi:hypothetical protein